MAVTNTIILLKRGSGKPVSLEYGEIALDTSEKVIYAGTLSGSVIEMSGGSINWNQIDPDTLPPGLGGPDAIDLTELERQVKENTGKIGEIQAELILIWNELVAVRGIAEAALSLATSNKGEIDTHTDQIEALQKEVELIESGLIFGGVYNSSTGKISQLDSYALDRGFIEGQILTSNTTEAQQGIYFICNDSGTVTILPGGDKSCQTGDWLVATGLSWTLINYGFDTILIENVVGLETALEDLGDEIDKVAGRVTSLETKIDCGSYTPTGTP